MDNLPSYRVRFEKYEREKKELMCSGLSPTEYEKAIKKLAEKYEL